MRKNILAFALTLATAAPLLARADTLRLPTEGDAPAAVSLPKKGESESAVLKSFGTPQKKYAPVGGDAPRHPPITRWDYAGFSVFFEHAHVVDAVVPGHPAPLYHTESLTPAKL